MFKNYKFKNFYKLNLSSILKFYLVSSYLTRSLYHFELYNDYTILKNLPIERLSINLFSKSQFRSKFPLAFKSLNFSTLVSLEDPLIFFYSYINYFNFLTYSPYFNQVNKSFFNSLTNFDDNLKKIFRFSKKIKNLSNLHYKKKKVKFRYKDFFFLLRLSGVDQIYFVFLIFYYRLYSWNCNDENLNTLFLKSSLTHLANYSLKYRLSEFSEELIPYSIFSPVEYNFDLFFDLHFEKSLGYKLVSLSNSLLKIY